MAAPLLTAISLLPTFLLLITLPSPAAAKTAEVAPGPTAEPLNLTAILEKGGQYTTFLRLLNETQVGKQVQSQLNNSYDGLTIIAPTDAAFQALKPGALNDLTAEEQVSLVLYHVLPRYYSLTTFQTASNPVRTQASGSHGVYNLHVTSTSNQVNVSTGVDQAPLQSALYSDFPLAVYPVDHVLLPYDLFGPKAPAAAPAPADEKPERSAKKKTPAAADGPVSEAEASPSAAVVRSIGWDIAAALAAVVCIGSHL